MGYTNGASPAPAIADSEARKVAVLAGELDSKSSKPTPNENQENEANGFYVPKDIKRLRRTKGAMVDIKKSIIDILSADNPQTVRQVFYALTVRGVIQKEEIEYKRTVVRLLGDMREAGEIPAAKLRELVRGCIERHVDQQQLELLKIAEQSERELLKKWAGVVKGGGA